MKTILVVCPIEEDIRELSKEHFASSYNFLFYDHSDEGFKNALCKRNIPYKKLFNPQEFITDVTEYISQNPIDGIISTGDYLGSIFTSILANKHGLKGSQTDALLTLQHKYYSRKLQQKYIPEVTPQFWLINEFTLNPEYDFNYPIFLKSVKSQLSICAYKIESKNELMKTIATKQLPNSFLYPFDWFLKHYTSYSVSAYSFIAETYLEGVQCTLEGFLDHNEVTVVGIVDSIMLPGTISFHRFIYPSSLADDVQKRMADITKKLMIHSGLSHGFFNIEFMYNPKKDEIFIIEVNPRMASQFSDLFEKVDGINPYAYLIKLALGEKVEINSFKKGKYPMAGACIYRSLNDCRLVAIPTEEDIKKFYKYFPDGRYELFIQKGEALSDWIQDGYSFRYCAVNLGAQDRDDLEKQAEKSMALLPFEFKPV